MKLNTKKTKCLPFINSQTKDFMPQLELQNGTFLEIIYKLKLVGLVVTSDLTWHAHVQYTVSRVNKVVWQLIRFKSQGAPQNKQVFFYILKIRSGKSSTLPSLPSDKKPNGNKTQKEICTFVTQQRTTIVQLPT